MRVSQKEYPMQPLASRKCELGASGSRRKVSGCGLSGARRRAADNSALVGVTKSDIRRLARKAGAVAWRSNVFGQTSSLSIS